MADSTLPIGSAVDLTAPARSPRNVARKVAFMGGYRRPQEARPDVYRIRPVLSGGRGVEALLLRIQLAVPNNHFLSPEVFNRHLHHAWHHHGFPHGDAVDHWIRQLSRALDDRRPGYGFPAAQCLQLLDDRAGRIVAVLQLHRWSWSAGGGKRARCYLVGVCAVDRKGFFSRA